MNILIVFDERAIRYSLREILTMEGYEVSAAESAEVGMEMYKKGTFDIVILSMEDLMLFLDETKQSGLSTKVIAMSGKANIRAKQSCLTMGAYGFLEIPVDLNELLNLLKQEKQELDKHKTPTNYPVITLCGSTRFKEQFLEVQKRLTLEGNIVISVGLFGHSGDEEAWTEGTKAMLDDMHKRKIDMADSIYVINVGGYIGESTQSEIKYALEKGKAVHYLEPIQ